MKVALVFDGLGFGGIEKVGTQYAQIFRDLGYEVDIFNLQPDHDEMEKMFPDGCNIIHKKMPFILLPEQYMLIAKRWRWGKFVYPLIYAVSYILMQIYRLFVGTHKKYDLTVAFSGHFRDLTFVAYDFVHGQKKMAWLHGALIEYLVSCSTYGDLYRKINNLVTLSSGFEKNTLLANYNLQKLHIQKIYNPISLEVADIDDNKVKELQDKYKDFMVMVGRFGIDKDQETVIRAMSCLKQDTRFKHNMVFVGDGAKLESCKALVKELHLEDCVFFEGARYDVQNYYTAAKLTVHSSPAEGLPTVLLESMKYKTPIVATDSLPGVSEILGNDEFGVKCEVGNPEDMAKKIFELLTNQEKCDYYIKKGFERVNDFSYEKIREEFSQYLTDL